MPDLVDLAVGGGGAGGNVNVHDGAGVALTSTVVGADQALDVNIVAGAGAGGTSMVDDAPFTPGVTAITPIGAMLDDVAPDTVNEGDAGIPRMSANRVLYAQLRDAAGNERGLNIDAAGAITVADGGGSLTVDDGGLALSVDDAGGSLTIDDGGLTLGIDDAGGSLTIDNTTLAVVGGGVEAGALRVTVANNSTGLLSIDDGGASLTVDGTVSANIRDGAGVALTSTLVGADQALDVNLVQSVNLTIQEPLGVDDNGGSLTVDNPALSVVGGGAEATALRVTVANDSTGVLTVDDGGASLTVDNPALSVVGGGVEATAIRVTIANDSTGLLSVDDNGGSLSVDDNAGSLTVDNPALSVVGGGVEATAQRVTLANDSTGVLTVDDGGASLTVDGTVTASNCTGNVADDAIDAGNPVKIGAYAVETDGTTPGSVSAEADRTDLKADRDGRLLVNTGHPFAWYTNNNYAVAQTNQQQKAAPGAGFSLYITAIIMSTDTAMNILIVDDTVGVPATILGPYYFAANGGMVAMTFEPAIRITANENIGITSSAAGNHTVTINGYTAP